MTNSSANGTQKRPPILEYGKGIKRAYKLIQAIGYLYALFILWLGYEWFILLNNKNVEQPEQQLMFSLLAWGALYYTNHRLLKPMALSKVQVLTDRLIVRQETKETVLLFSEIVKIQKQGFGRTGGAYHLFFNNRKKFRFTPALNNAHVLLDAINQFNSQLLARNEFVKMRNHLILAQQSRSWAIWSNKNLPFSIIPFLVLPLGTFFLLIAQQSSRMTIYHQATYLFETFFKVYLVVLIFGLLFSQITYKILEQAALKRLSQDPRDIQSDPVQVQNTYRQHYPAFLALLLSVYSSIYLFDLNFLTWEKAGNAIPHLGLQSSQRVLIDKRYNCINCRFSLKENDRVLIRNKDRKKFLVRIVGLPHQTIPINAKDEQGRFLASVTPTEVPEGKLAVQMKPHGSVFSLIDLPEVQGRIIPDLYSFFYTEDSDRQDSR